MDTLFDNAKEQKKAASKSEKELITLEPKEQKQIEKDIRDFKKAYVKFENAKAVLEAKKAAIKETGEGVFVALYNANQTQPDTFCLGTEDDKIQFQVSKKYKVDDENFEYLVKIGVAEQKNTYSFNPDLMDDKMMKKLSKAIKGMKGVSDAAKKNLIKVTRKKTIKSDTLEKLPIICSQEDVEYQLAELYAAIQPTCSVKNVG